MSDWTEGYVADIGYTFGYYSELNPIRSRLPFLNSGLESPEIKTACELGFGQGLSTNIHAAASEIDWYGTDFNPSQTCFAQHLSKASGANAQLYDQAFEEFCERSDLPEFDFIGLHGIWSWISDENRKFIVNFVRKKLRVGGILYISYNTLPGWAAFAPMRNLLVQHAEVIGSEGRGIVSKIEGALEFADDLLSINPLYKRANPQVEERLKSLKKQNRHYLAHEYFNKDWAPMHFYNMAQWLSAAKLDFACPAHYIDHIDIANMTSEQSTFVKSIPDPILRQSVRDFVLNQTFRRDYWVKGARRLSPVERNEQILNEQIVLLENPENVSMKLNMGQGEASLSEGVYTPILEELADHKPISIEELYSSLKPKGMELSQLVQAIFILGGRGQLSSVQNIVPSDELRTKTGNLNTEILQKSRAGEDITFLASPVTGGGVSVQRMEQVYLLAISGGAKSPEEIADFAWSQLESQNITITTKEKTLESKEEIIPEFINQAKEFLEKKIPMLRAVGVA